LCTLCRKTFVVLTLLGVIKEIDKKIKCASIIIKIVYYV